MTDSMSWLWAASCIMVSLDELEAGWEELTELQSQGQMCGADVWDLDQVVSFAWNVIPLPPFISLFLSILKTSTHLSRPALDFAPFPQTLL